VARAKKGELTVSLFALRARAFAGGVVTGIIAFVVPAVAQQKATPPDFSWNYTIGWIGEGANGPKFAPVPGRVPPVTSDSAHPFEPNNPGRQATFRIADLTNPNLKPWVKEYMKKDNDNILAGKIAFTPRSSCMPAGVPGFMAYSGVIPVYFIQTPTQVLIIYSGDQQVRRVSLDAPHLLSPKSSWYGESVGHYEGDTLVIDTIGQTTKSFVDLYRTPHTEKLHVVERWRMVDGGKSMEVVFTVDDPDTYYEPWSGTRRYRRVEQPFSEMVCAEGNRQLFDYHIPMASEPDF
jgi:hypothetical protein